MQGFKTVDEKALELNITPRHVQHLCRTGKIEGAVKHAGVWFIPDAAPVPVKNTKTGVKGFRFVGTKNSIFTSAIELFMLKGYGNVSLRDIADRVGIRQSTIYNHFKSKQEILDTIYDYYCYFHLKSRPTLEEMESIIASGDLNRIIDSVRYDFPIECRQHMADITKIICQSLSIDPRAKEIAKNMIIAEGVAYVRAVFDRAIELGHFQPFDTHVMALFVNAIRIFTMYRWIVETGPDDLRKMQLDEKTLLAFAHAFMDPPPCPDCEK